MKRGGKCFALLIGREGESLWILIVGFMFLLAFRCWYLPHIRELFVFDKHSRERERRMVGKWGEKH